MLGQAETTVEAQSGLSEAKTEVRARANGAGLLAEQQNWRCRASLGNDTSNRRRQ